MTTDVHDPIRTLGPVQLRVPAEPSLSRVLRLAASEGVTPVAAAQRLAEARIAAAPAREPFTEAGA